MNSVSPPATSWTHPPHGCLKRFVASAPSRSTRTRQPRRVCSTSRADRGAPELRGEAYCLRRSSRMSWSSSTAQARDPVRPGPPGAVYDRAGGHQRSRRSGAFGSSCIWGANVIPSPTWTTVATPSFWRHQEGLDGEVLNVVDDDLPRAAILAALQAPRQTFRSIRCRASRAIPVLLWEKYSECPRGSSARLQSPAWHAYWKGAAIPTPSSNAGGWPRAYRRRRLNAISRAAGTRARCRLGGHRRKWKNRRLACRADPAHQGSDLVAVCDREELMARQLAERFDVGALSTTRPTPGRGEARGRAHHDTAAEPFRARTAVSRARCHVYVEKPSRSTPRGRGTACAGERRG